MPRRVWGMVSTRRNFLARTACLTGLGGVALAEAGCQVAPASESPSDARGDAAPASEEFRMTPIGAVEQDDAGTRIRIHDRYTDGLLGLNEWSHVQVFWWFDQNDVPQRRAMLQVHPRGNRSNPLTGVFACRAPVRPNLLALSTCKILSLQGAVVELDTIDAFHGTPVLDLKPLIPPDLGMGNLRIPSWTGSPRS